MKTTVVNKLRASVVAASAASLVLIAPAFAQEQQDIGDLPSFSELDQNQDQMLDNNELQGFAEQQQMDLEAIIVSFDLDGNEQLNQAEFESLAGAPSRVARQPVEQEADQDGALITVDQQPTQITVKKPAAQVVIDQPRPKVTIITQDPEIQVEQAEPQVSVTQPKPEVSVDQAEPRVVIDEAEPNVRIQNAEPQVEVNQAEPNVAVLSAEAELSQQMDPAAEVVSIYVLPLPDLRTAEIVDQQGEAIGNVEEVVIKRDASEAGLIISTTTSAGEARHVYRSADDFSVDGDLLVFNAEAQALEQPQGFVSREFMAVPLEEGNLQQILNQEGLSAR